MERRVKKQNTRGLELPPASGLPVRERTNVKERG